MKKIKIFEKRVRDNPVGRWYDYYFFGKKIRTKLVFLYRHK